MVGAVTDISEQHPSRGDLPQNLAFLRALTEDTPDGIWVKDRDGRYLMINCSAARLVQRSPAEVLGRLDEDLFPPTIAEQIRADELRVLTEGMTHCFEYTLENEAEGRTILATRSPFRDEQGQIIGVMGISHDITLRKRAETALRESQEKFRDLVETTKEWIWASDASGRLTYSNPAVENLLGYRPEELAGRDAFALMVEEEREAAQTFLARCVQVRMGWTGWVLRWRHKDGSSRCLESNGAPVFDAAGNLVGFRGSDRDITERQLLEERLRYSQKLESIGRLAGGIAHEFNNLLTVILGYSDLALQTLGPQNSARNAFEAIAKAGRRAAWPLASSACSTRAFSI
jgi:PAS domain S-box-containing protein